MNSKYLLTVGCIATALALATPSPTRAQDVEGDWEVRWAQAIRTWDDGSFEIQGWGDAELSIARSGDSLSGTWTTDVQERVTWSFQGTLEGERFTLVSTGHDSENPELAIVESIEWSGAFTADGLEGQVMMRIRGRDREPARRPFTAVRREPH